MAASRLCAFGCSYVKAVGSVVVLTLLAASLGGCDLSGLPYPGEGPGSPKYLDTYRCIDVPTVVRRQLVDSECATAQVPCRLTLGVVAAAAFPDDRWLAYGAVIDGPKPDVEQWNVYGVPMYGMPHYWLVDGAFDGSGVVTSLYDGEFADLLRDHQTSERDGSLRLISGPPGPAYCLTIVEQAAN